MKRFVLALLLVVLPGSAFALQSASQNSEGGVTLRANVGTGSVLDPGDHVSFQYQSARDGAVVLFDIDTQGYVSVLNPDPANVRAFQNTTVPDDGSELFAEGEPGVEFVFAVAVSDPSAIDGDAIASLNDGSRRIDGDPFIAANMIAAELVRNISQHTVFMGYTYFYVSDRVEYPCYLCGGCDGSPSSECDGYQITQNFARGVDLTYPLARGYTMTDVTAKANTDSASDAVAIPDDPDVVNFYPYGSEVHYADPVAVNLWYNWGFYDPMLWYYPYPYCYNPWNFSIGFGWGWGNWGWGYGCGGYYNCGYYDPWCGGGYYGGGYYGNGGTYPTNVTKFKSYKSASAAPTLAQNRAWASKRDGDMRVATKGVRSKATPATYHSKSSTNTGTYAGNRLSGTGHHVKTSVSGTRSATRNVWAQGRKGSVYRSSPTHNSGTYRGNSAGGRTIQQRSGATRSKNYYTPSTRGGSSSKGTWAPSHGKSSGSGSRSSYSSAPRMKSYSGSAPSSRGGWSGGGGSRGSAGGGSRGGGGGGGYHGGGGAMKGGHR